MPKLSALLVRTLPVLVFALLSGGSAGAAPLVALDGTLHERDLRPRLFRDDSTSVLAPAQLPSGRFSFYAGADLRIDPQAAVLETDADGWLVALAPESLRLLAPPRRDPESGRTLRPDAPDGAICATGEEPDCWRPGDPPLAVEDVVDALCAAVGADVSTCRFREHLGTAPVSFSGDAVLPPTREPTSGVDLLNADAGVLMQSFVGFPSASASEFLAVRQTLAFRHTLSNWDPLNGDPMNGDLDNEQLVLPSAFPVSGGQQFVNEMAALSFNFQLVLAAFSGNGSPSNEPAAFDPDNPFSTTTGQCSLLQPQFCSSVQAFFSLQDARLRALPDDPFGTPHERWIWEAGAELEIAAAGGALGRFAGGKLFALGPERARIGDPEAEIGVTFLLVSDDPAETPQLFFAAPEPEGGALAGAALATLVAVSRRRRARS